MSAEENEVWDLYVQDKGTRPQTAAQLMNWSKVHQNAKRLSFSVAKQVFANRSKDSVEEKTPSDTAKSPTVDTKTETDSNEKPKQTAKPVENLQPEPDASNPTATKSAQPTTAQTSSLSNNDEDTDSKHDLDQLLQEREEWQRERARLQKKVQALEQEKRARDQERERERENAKNTTRRPKSFWNEIKSKMGTDPDFVKALIKNKQLSFDHVDEWKNNILLIAASAGNYDMVQFCINMGADINSKGNGGVTAQRLAGQNGHHHVEQLLAFSQMNVNVGNEVKNMADILLKQDGMTKSVLNELQEIGDESNQLFCKTLMELMISIITKKKCFSDDMLNLCWSIMNKTAKNPLESELWHTIKMTVADVIARGSPTDWYWLKVCVLPSAIFYREVKIESSEQKSKKKKKKKKADGPPNYLYFELLKLVEEESRNQLSKLEQNLNVLAEQYPSDWHALTTWDIPDTYDRVRQDAIPNGLVSQYSKDQLSESSNAAFASAQFYDYNQYLSQLVLVAQIVDDNFHQSVQAMFDIDKVSKRGIIPFDRKPNEDEKQQVGDGVIVYSRGPVKLIERARYKAQNDYAYEDYPTSACVLDFNRCSLIFHDISTMLAALELFVNKVKYYQSGSIIGIVRDKNGFIEYVKETNYADIKLNVLISGSPHNIIGEVQFLLYTMKKFKEGAHNLYAITRQKETMESSVAKILPSLLDRQKQIFIAANMGNTKSLCAAMVIDGFARDAVLQTIQKQKTIVHSLCEFGHLNALRFIRSLLMDGDSDAAFVSHVMADDTSKQKPIEYAIQHSRLHVVQYLLSMKSVKAEYDGNMFLLFRALYHCFKYNRNQLVVDCVLSELEMTDKVGEIVGYNRTGVADRDLTQYDRDSIFVALAWENSVESLKRLISLLGGEEVFVKQHLFDVDKWNKNFLEVAVRNDNLEIIDHVLSMQGVKQQYMASNEWMWRLMYWLFAKSHDVQTMDYVLQKLEVDGKTLATLVVYQCPERTYKDGEQFERIAPKYNKFRLLGRLAMEAKLSSLKRIREIIDDDEAFGAGVFALDGWQNNALVMAVQPKQMEKLQYLLSVEAVRKRCMQDLDEMHALLSRVTHKKYWNEKLCEMVIVELELTEKKLNVLKQHKDINISKMVNKINQMNE